MAAVQRNMVPLSSLQANNYPNDGAEAGVSSEMSMRIDVIFQKTVNFIVSTIRTSQSC